MRLEGIKQGQYQRSGVLWHSESLNKKVRRYVQENAFVKDSANLTTFSFYQWINEQLLVNETLEPGYPRTISVETARRWLHELGFEQKRVALLMVMNVMTLWGIEISFIWSG